MSAFLHGPTLWYATRATGLVTMLLLTASVLLGILTTGRFAGGSWPRFLTVGLHRNLALLTVMFLALHVGTTVVDQFVSIPLTAAFVPFTTSYKGAWVGLGAVALDLLIAVTITSLLRARIGLRTWRGLHWVAYAMWPIALGHALLTGTDRGATWMIGIAVAGAIAVAAASSARLVEAMR